MSLCAWEEVWGLGFGETLKVEGLLSLRCQNSRALVLREYSFSLVRDGLCTVTRNFSVFSFFVSLDSLRLF